MNGLFQHVCDAIAYGYLPFSAAFDLATATAKELAELWSSISNLM